MIVNTNRGSQIDLIGEQIPSEELEVGSCMGDDFPLPSTGYVIVEKDDRNKMYGIIENFPRHGGWKIRKSPSLEIYEEDSTFSGVFYGTYREALKVLIQCGYPYL